MTTPPVDDPEALRRILGQAEALFLDFDGPVCNLFAGLPASVVVDQLCVVLADGGYGDPPPEIEKSSDPFDVLKYAATLGKTEAEYVNAAFTAHEVEAVATARPTPGAATLIRAWTQSQRPLAIVSNNSSLAVNAYLQLHRIDTFVNYVSARRSPVPTLLKPSPFLILDALNAVRVSAVAAIFVGDSATDIEAARTADVRAVGYANKPGKRSTFDSLNPAAIVDSIETLAMAVN